MKLLSFLIFLQLSIFSCSTSSLTQLVENAKNAIHLKNLTELSRYVTPWVFEAIKFRITNYSLDRVPVFKNLEELEGGMFKTERDDVLNCTTVMLDNETYVLNDFECVKGLMDREAVRLLNLDNRETVATVLLRKIQDAMQTLDYGKFISLMTPTATFTDIDGVVRTPTQIFHIIFKNYPLLTFYDKFEFQKIENFYDSMVIHGDFRTRNVKWVANYSENWQLDSELGGLRISALVEHEQLNIDIITRTFQMFARSLRLLSMARLSKTMIDGFKIIDCKNVETRYSLNEFMQHYANQSPYYDVNTDPYIWDLVSNHTAGTLKFVTKWNSAYNEYTLLRDGSYYKFAVEKHLHCQKKLKTDDAPTLKHEIWKMEQVENLLEQYKQSYRNVSTLFTDLYTLANRTVVKSETLAQRQSDNSLSWEVVEVNWPGFKLESFLVEEDRANYGCEFKVVDSGNHSYKLQGETKYIYIPGLRDK